MSLFLCFIIGVADRCIKTFVRSVIKKAFSISSTEEHALQVWVADISLKYEQGSTPGPDHKKLLLDMTGKISSKWNRAVMHILMELVKKKMSESSNKKKLPTRSSAYIEDVIMSYMVRARGAWKRSRPKQKKDGMLETSEEVEKRMIDENSERAKQVRVLSRRTMVGISSYNQIFWLTYGIPEV